MPSSAQPKSIQLFLLSILGFVNILGVVSVLLQVGVQTSADFHQTTLIVLFLASFVLGMVTHISRNAVRDHAIVARILLFIFTGVFYMHQGVLLLILYVMPICFDVFYFTSLSRRIMLSSLLAAGLSYSVFEFFVLGRTRFDLSALGIACFFVCSALSSVVGVLAARLSLKHQQLLEENANLKVTVDYLTTTSAKYLRFASLTESKARQKERYLITREFHDVVGYSLTNIIALLDNAMLNPPMERDSLTNFFRLVRDTSAKGLAEVRTIIYRLRSLNYRIEGLGAVANLARTFEESTGVKVKIDYSNCLNDLGSRLNLIVLRVIQESLVNAFRHGRASAISIYFWMEDSRLQLVIRDNGRVPEVGETGIGQKGMEDRVKRVGGSIQFESRREGYTVMASLPVRERRIRNA